MIIFKSKIRKIIKGLERVERNQRQDVLKYGRYNKYIIPLEKIKAKISILEELLNVRDVDSK